MVHKGSIAPGAGAGADFWRISGIFVRGKGREGERQPAGKQEHKREKDIQQAKYITKGKDWDGQGTRSYFSLTTG